jgi:Ca2+-transporting ATPase
MTKIPIHSIEVNEAINALNSRQSGLSSSEVEDKRLEFGYNEIEETAKRSPLLLFLKQFKSLLIGILMIAALISAVSGYMVDAYVIMAVVILNSIIGFLQEYRAEQAVEALKKMVVSKAKVLRDGELVTINSRELVPGDIVVLEEGDSIPADGRLIEVKNLRSIEAALTGESVPVAKTTQTFDESTAMADRLNMVYKGTFVAAGYGKMLVVGTGKNTELGEIAETLSGIRNDKTNFQVKSDRLARQMAFIAIFSAMVLFLTGYFLRDMNLTEIALTSLAALVSAIPEGLPAILSVVLAVGANRMAKNNAVVREFSATEALGSVTTIVTDKTGTLTMNVLTVRKLFIPGISEFSVSGDGWAPIGEIKTEEGSYPNEAAKAIELVAEIAQNCTNASITKTATGYELSGDPTEGALMVLARKIRDGKKLNREKTDDIPFNSDLKMRASLVRVDDKNLLMVVGAPEKVLERCKSSLQADGRSVTIDDSLSKQLAGVMESWANEALRVIALGYKEMPIGTSQICTDDLTDLTFAAFTGMIDPPRPEVPQAIRNCHAAGIRVIMATGDHVSTAAAIARQIGIIPESAMGRVAITEADLVKLSPEEFEEVVSKVNVFARLTPIMKLRIAEVLQSKGELIAMTGDGVNDAPTLKKADIGISMGIMGTDVARSASQIVLTDDNFSSIVKAVEQGRIVFKNARNASFFLVTTNFAEITTLLTTIAFGFPVPLTATQILWLNLVTDGACGIALSVEESHKDVLKDKPIDRKENILTKEIVPFLLIMMTLMATLSVLTFKYYVHEEGIDKARTAVFVIMAFTQLFNSLNMRALRRSVFEIGLFSNKYLNLGIIVSIILILLIIETPGIQDIFSFDTVYLGEFLILFALSSLVLVAGEIYKWFRYRNHR